MTSHDEPAPLGGHPFVGLDDVMTCRGRGPITVPCPQSFDDLGVLANGLG